jgi:dienelactone hydrolase
MKKLLLLNLTLFAVATIATAQQKFRTTSSSVIGYLEYLPEGYNENSNKYPIVIFLHGNGEKGPNSTDTTVLKQYINLVAKHGPPKHVNNGSDFPFILISPQLKSNNSTWTSAYVMEVINHCKTYLKIDERRIYITGLSLGGGGTWVAAQDYPALFAAIAPVCGGYNATSKACGIAGENLPVWAFHGDSDSVVPLSRSTTMVNAINACVPAPSPLAKMTIYPGVGHNAWDYAYKTDNSLHNPNVYQWLLSYTNTSNNGNKIPVANGGYDKVIAGKTSGTITGSGVDPDGTIASYNWKKISGPSVTLLNTTSSTVSLSALTLGTYIFRLQVTDNNGNTDSDYVKVTVTPNNPPTANAGSDRVITLPVTSCSITGTGTDTDGTISKYAWRQISGAVATMSGTTATTLNISALSEGVCGFELTVTDNNSATGKDTVYVTVAPPVIPIVNAGTDKLVKLPTTSATITGSATDAGGTIIAYKWIKVSGGGCTMANVTGTSLKLSGLTSGTYVFKLSATDNDGNVGSDEIKIVVDAPPVVNAGADRAITLPLSGSVVLNGSATDSDGTIIKYQWSKYSGPNISGSGSTTANYTITTLYDGTYVFKLAVTDNLGAVGVDYVTITVKSSIISGTSTGRVATEVYDASELESQQEEQHTSLVDTNAESLIGAHIALFDSSGKPLYAGKWKNDLQEMLSANNGLIIYNIRYNDGRSRSGKVIFKD